MKSGNLNVGNVSFCEFDGTSVPLFSLKQVFDAILHMNMLEETDGNIWLASTEGVYI